MWWNLILSVERVTCIVFHVCLGVSVPWNADMVGISRRILVVFLECFQFTLLNQLFSGDIGCIICGSTDACFVKGKKRLKHRDVHVGLETKILENVLLQTYYSLIILACIGGAGSQEGLGLYSTWILGMLLKHNTTWIIRFYLVGKLLLCLLKRTGKSPRKCAPRSVLGTFNLRFCWSCIL